MSSITTSTWLKILFLELVGVALILPPFLAKFYENPAPQQAVVDETTPADEIPGQDLSDLTEATPSATPAPTPPPPAAQNSTYLPEVSRCLSGAARVNFSFDAGSGSQSIQAILDTLSKHQVTGTFFLTGKWAEANPGWTAQIALSGHEVFNHTYDHAPRNTAHPGLTNYSDEEIRQELSQADSVIGGLVNRSTKPYFRPPYGDRNARVLAAAWSAGYRSIYWTVDALDWKPGETDESVRGRIMSRLTPGAIYLMHVGDDITGRILDGVMTEIKAKGYSLVSLSQCVK